MRETSDRTSSGNAELDQILQGGLPSGRLHLVEGAPGSGKTTLAMRFLMDGAERGERCLYITLSETREELLAVAASHGFDLSAIDIFELPPPRRCWARGGSSRSSIPSRSSSAA